jgi:hypothetical protein
MVVVALMSTVAAVGVIQLRATRSVLEAQTTANQVVDQIAYAQQVAINQRRNVLIQFLDTNEIRVTRLESDGSSTVLATTYLPEGYVYDLPAGEPPDTPEEFGNEAAVSFNGAAGGTFLGDGTFVDSTGIVLNGSVFTKGSGQGSERAVTLTGATGRILRYQLINGVWEPANH